MTQMTLQQGMDLAIRCHQAGRLSEAEAIYHQILNAKPDQPDCLHLLGLIVHQRGNSQAAIELIRRAIAIDPQNPMSRSNLGMVLTAHRQFDEAVDILQAALKLNSGFAEAHYNLGMALAGRRQFDAAIAAYRAAIQCRPDYADAHHNLSCLLAQGGDIAQAIATLQRAIALAPRHAASRSNLGTLLREQGGLDEAMDQFNAALSLDPSHQPAYLGLGNVLKDQGQTARAVECYRKAVALTPEDAAAGSNLLYTLCFDRNADETSIAREALRWSQFHSRPLSAQIRPHDNDRDPNRRLRIGYVSPDFRSHAESFFVLPLLRGHDHSQFEIHCYSSVARPDSITDQTRASADVWHEVADLDDAALSEQIRRDQIDILIDLTMHMSCNRLGVFSRKPAPLQVAWLAYPGTTGLATIDYRLTDSYMDPPGADDRWAVERPMRLPDCWCCYDPLEDVASPVDPPSLRAGGATFGSMNSCCKTNEQVLTLWSRVLAAAPDSRLLMLCPHGRHRSQFLAFFQSQGISASRIEFVADLPRTEYLRLYRQIDVSLDPFPYNGITTTCDSLWMGVPVVTLVGQRPASRAGLGLLSTVGINELIAKTQDDYVRLAAELASDRHRLAKYRVALRQQMRESPLMDSCRFARNVEQAYRRIWVRWASG